MIRTFTLVALVAFLPGTASAASPAIHPGKVIAYICPSHKNISVTYLGAERAIVEYDGQRWYMARARSADGGRYVGASHQWWTTGPLGTLSSLRPETPVERDCRQKR